MSKEEQKAMYIACCKACTLAEVMKDCKGCKFNIGLPFKVIKADDAKSLELTPKDSNIVLSLS